MTKLNLKSFVKEYNLKNDIKSGSELRKVYNFPLYASDSKKYSDKGFVNLDNEQVDGTHWTCFL